MNGSGADKRSEKQFATKPAKGAGELEFPLLRKVGEDPFPHMPCGLPGLIKVPT